MGTQISYTAFCKFGALRNRLLYKMWCRQCKDWHYYAREGQLICPPS